MKALLDQLPALLGVVVGAVGAMASSALTDRLRWRRDQAVRWDQRRLDAYLTFTSTIKDAVRISHRLTAHHRHEVIHAVTSREAAVQELDDASKRNTKEWEALLLLGDPDTVEAARRWRLAAGTLAALALGDHWDAAGWTAAVHRLDRARDEFHAAARRGLGVAGGSVAQFVHLRDMHGDATLVPETQRAAETAPLAWD